MLTVRQVRFDHQRSFSERSWRCISCDLALTQQDADNDVLPRLLTLLTEHQIAELHEAAATTPRSELAPTTTGLPTRSVGRAIQLKQKRVHIDMKNRALGFLVSRCFEDIDAFSIASIRSTRQPPTCTVKGCPICHSRPYDPGNFRHCRPKPLALSRSQ